MDVNSAIVSLDDQGYRDSLLRLVDSVSDRKVCFIGMGTHIKSLVRDMDSEGYSHDSILFIDPHNSHTDNRTIRVKSPHALTDLSIAVSTVLQNNTVDMFIFDSLSSVYRTHNSVSIVQKIVSQLVDKVHAHGSSIIFTSHASELNANYIKACIPLVDKIVPLHTEQIPIRTNKYVWWIAGVGISLSVLGLIEGNMFLTGFSIFPLAAKKIEITTFFIFFIVLLSIFMISFLFFKLGKNWN